VIFGQNTIAAGGLGARLAVGQRFVAEWNF